MNGLWQTPLPGLLLTVGIYAALRRAGALAKGHPLSNPVLWTILALALLLRVAAVPYATYFESAKFLHFLLGPATVALAVPLARELPRIRALAFPLLGGLVAGNLAAIFSALALGKLFGASPALLRTLAPKSVTTPIAMGIAEQLGGLPSLTAVLVILTGILGAVLGPWLLDRMGIRDPFQRGTAMGVAAHGLGTAAIHQESPTAGAASGLAMGLSGLLTALLLPFLLHLGWI